jgi:predicted aldo/keto reductase-like oxidoreductase
MRARLVLGANRFNLLSQYQVDQLLSSALELEVSHIDTAPTYLTSEDKVGNFLRRNQGAFNVTTKIFRNQEQINERIAYDSVQQSLESLGVNQINCLYVHGTNIPPSDLAVLDVLQNYRETGIVQKIGWCGPISDLIYNKPNLYDSLMIRINPWDRAIESRADLLTTKELVGMNIFANGFWNYKQWGRFKTFYSAHLLQRFNPRPTFYLNHPDSIELESFQNFESLVKFALSRNYLHRIVVGTLSQEHLKQIVRWVSEIEGSQ